MRSSLTCENQGSWRWWTPEGGAWARLKDEDSGQVFLLSQKYIFKCLCAHWIGSQGTALCAGIYQFLVSIGNQFSADYSITVGPNLMISTSDPCNFNSDQMLKHFSSKSVGTCAQKCNARIAELGQFGPECASVFLWGIIFLCRETLKTSRDWSTILLILVDSYTTELTRTWSYSDILFLKEKILRAHLSQKLSRDHTYDPNFFFKNVT